MKIKLFLQLMRLDDAFTAEEVRLRRLIRRSESRVRSLQRTEL
jgi:hypothetical protein